MKFMACLPPFELIQLVSDRVSLKFGKQCVGWKRIVSFS